MCALKIKLQGSLAVNFIFYHKSHLIFKIKCQFATHYFG